MRHLQQIAPPFGRGRSRELHTGHLAQSRNEVGPVFALPRKRRPAQWRDAVVAAPALAGFLDPAALQPPSLLEAVQRGIQGREREAEPSASPLVDQLRNLVA